MEFITVKKIIEEKPNLDFGSIFNNSIELFKKVWVEGLVVVLLTFVAILPFYLVLFIPMATAGMMDPGSMQSEEPPVWFILYMIVAYPIVILGIMTIGNALQAEFMRICRNKDLDIMEKPDYFRYLKGTYLKKTFVLGLYGFGISLLGMLACGIGVFYVIVPISLLPAFYAFNEELTVSEIVKSAFALGNKNWLVIFGLILVCGILAELGILACGIGILFTAMFSKVPMYFMYKDGVGAEIENRNGM